MMADNRSALKHEIGELCDDLQEHVEDDEQAEAIATAEQLLQKVRQYFGVKGG